MPPIIPISGVIGWDVLASDLRKSISKFKGQAVEFELNTPGGFVSEGFEIFNLIRNHDGETTIKIVGLAASMGAYLLMAPNRVVAEDNAVIMIHNARSCTCGDQHDHDKTSARLKGLSGIIANSFVKGTNLIADDIHGKMKAETFFFGQEMVDSGFVDELIEVSDDIAQIEAIEMARAQIDGCNKSMRDNIEFEKDLEKAVAIFPDLAHIEGSIPSNNKKPLQRENKNGRSYQ